MSTELRCQVEPSRWCHVRFHGSKVRLVHCIYYSTKHAAVQGIPNMQLGTCTHLSPKGLILRLVYYNAPGTHMLAQICHASLFLALFRAFSPLEGFMNQENYDSVVSDMRLKVGPLSVLCVQEQHCKLQAISTIFNITVFEHISTCSPDMPLPLGKDCSAGFLLYVLAVRDGNTAFIASGLVTLRCCDYLVCSVGNSSVICVFDSAVGCPLLSFTLDGGFCVLHP